MNYTVEHQWDEQSSQVVMEGLKTFNAAFMGDGDPKKLSVMARNEEGEIVGGVLADTKWDWMYIAWLWINERYRSSGIGRELMQQVEREGIEKGCRHAHLVTLDFQAREFYEKLGYEVFATLEDFPPGHARFMMKKRIA